MSRITDVIIVSPSEGDAMDPLTRLDESRAWYGYFNLVGERLWETSGKSTCCKVWVGAFNHLERSALLADLAALPWWDPQGVQVLIHDEEDSCAGLWMFVGGDLVEVPLPMRFRSRAPGGLEYGLLQPVPEGPGAD
ncbi:hypothetical protein KDL01_08650 [Actinospica durhamensis]|uniref:Uncharacterized protein n=1 Tax=Actinospica durhamensis TaxID=1508375 RepID=A0A941ELZ8_9ACTN|nr:hypothetical protein [Actinospica durhamensis]MBR7833333.1 hypothetical protein [Actinospica durhamensis]